ncbi:hypothetical protein [Pseudonocardia sp. N23]|uniref:hypothetical protein n=1 Tax=Pseudonocardia sp. N23 TaxID=1987376 RepID=UPI000C028094|nr:hypothetical protein [Pseudonocardia sp. N23]GAY10925.1 hypothetical protein TOK_5410 [Pseudonocardia sp. N23]
MDSRRLTVSACSAVAAAVVAFVALLPLSPSYRATAEVILVPNPAAAAQQTTSGTLLDPQRGVMVAAAVFGEPQWLAPATAAASIPSGTLTVTATVVQTTPMIQLSVITETGAHAAEVALATLVSDATPLVEKLSGPYSVVVVARPDGTGTATGLDPSTIRMVAAAAVLVAVLGATWGVLSRRDRRGDRDGQLPDSSAASTRP